MSSTTHPAFETLSERELPEYRASGLLFRHRASGCEVYKLKVEDPENCFALSFRTPSKDSSGAAHVVEHSVLCGSSRYPAKDPFLVMARRSLATFLNAFTYPDKTVYPAASAVKADFFNLLDVYGDAVFSPLLSQDTFLQEAHRYEYGSDGRLDIKGVVYNEMRGDYASAESLASTYATTSLFERGHPYSFDSGGKPEEVAALSYAGFRDFWAEHYRPSNCRIALYGDIDVVEELDFLDKRFLAPLAAKGNSAAKNGDANSGVGSARVADVPIEAPWLLPKRIELPCPEGESEGAHVLVSWLLPEQADQAELLALELLSELLLGHDGAPLIRALQGSGLGEDISPHSGFDTNYRQPIFTAGLRGVPREKAADVEALVIGAIVDYVKKGVDAEELETALHSMAFSHKEIRRGAGTYGLRLINRALRGWMHGEPPEASLSFEEPLAVLKSRLEANPRYLAELAERSFTRNQHRVTLSVYPEPALFAQKALSLSESLASFEARLSAPEREAIRAESARLAEAGAKPDSVEVLARFPSIRVRDIPHEIDIVPREAAEASGCPVSLHPIFTNGIVYLDLAFPLEGLEGEAFHWLPLLSRFIAGAGTSTLSYDKMAAALANKAGGFGTLLEVGSTTSGETLSFAILRLKALAENFGAASRLVFELLRDADSSDTKRLADLLSELGNDVSAALVPSGNAFASSRAAASLSEAAALDEKLRGIDQLLFLRRLRANGQGKSAEANIGAIAKTIASLSAALFARKGLRASLTAGREDLPLALEALGAGLASLPEAGKPLPTLMRPAGLSPTEKAAVHEAYGIATEVGFAAAACRASRLGSPGYAHETVLAHLLSTGPLWEEIRVRQGAYGASAFTDGLEGMAVFSTYRDPKPLASLSYFEKALQALARGEGLSASIAEEAVVGAVGHDLRPLLPEERGLSDFRRELYGIEDDVRKKKREDILGTRESDLVSAAGRLAEAQREASNVLISKAADVELFSRAKRDALVVDLSR
jgi:presequence protease